MKRIYDEQLLLWKANPQRKPLILRGVPGREHNGVGSFRVAVHEAV